MGFISNSQLKQVAQKINDNYAKKEGVYESLTAGNLTDANATGVSREFTLDNSCGSASISDTGSAVVKSFSGRTVVPNQMVTDTNNNSVTADGYASVTDGTANDAVSCIFKGESYVNNQLVPATQAKQVSSTGDATIPTDNGGTTGTVDIVGGNSKKWNQYCCDTFDNIDLDNGTDLDYSTYTTDKIISWTCNATGVRSRVHCGDNMPAGIIGHKYLLINNIYVASGVTSQVYMEYCGQSASSTY